METSNAAVVLFKATMIVSLEVRAFSSSSFLGSGFSFVKSAAAVVAVAAASNERHAAFTASLCHVVGETTLPVSKNTV
ncbi:hypothetical protein M0802_010403 [Mischocyttarus mexicanus]|nr:hypothetical protein M0802_010403 [Mischocyttarus mexicanus]